MDDNGNNQLKASEKETAVTATAMAMAMVTVAVTAGGGDGSSGGGGGGVGGNTTTLATVTATMTVIAATTTTAASTAEAALTTMVTATNDNDGGSGDGGGDCCKQPRLQVTMTTIMRKEEEGLPLFLFCVFGSQTEDGLSVSLKPRRNLWTYYLEKSGNLEIVARIWHGCPKTRCSKYSGNLEIRKSCMGVCPIWQQSGNKKYGKTRLAQCKKPPSTRRFYLFLLEIMYWPSIRGQSTIGRLGRGFQAAQTLQFQC